VKRNLACCTGGKRGKRRSYGLSTGCLIFIVNKGGGKGEDSFIDPSKMRGEIIVTLEGKKRGGNFLLPGATQDSPLSVVPKRKRDYHLVSSRGMGNTFIQMKGEKEKDPSL